MLLFVDMLKYCQNKVWCMSSYSENAQHFFNNKLPTLQTGINRYTKYLYAKRYSTNFKQIFKNAEKESNCYLHLARIRTSISAESLP